MTKVIRLGLHDGRPEGEADGHEGPSIGAHYTNNPKCKDASMTESMVNIWTGDYHLNCNCWERVVYK
jgi:hypothetical protein